MKILKKQMMAQKFILTDDTLAAKVDSLMEIAETVKAKLSKMENKKNSPNNKYLTRQETADYLRCSLSSLHRMVNNGTLPCRKVGRKSLFLLSDVENIILTLNV